MIGDRDWTDKTGEWTYPEKPENTADYQWRWKPVGYRCLLQWYDDATRSWRDEGVYKSRYDILDRIGR